MSERTSHTSNEQNKALRRERVLDFKREKAEVLALFESDADVASALSDLKQTTLMIERPEDDASIRQQIRDLQLSEAGELSAQGRVLVDDYRNSVKELVIDTGIRGDTAWAYANFGQERGQAMTEHYQRLAIEAVKTVGQNIPV